MKSEFTKRYMNFFEEFSDLSACSMTEELLKERIIINYDCKENENINHMCIRSVETTNEYESIQLITSIGKFRFTLEIINVE